MRKHQSISSLDILMQIMPETDLNEKAYLETVNFWEEILSLGLAKDSQP